MRNNSFLTGVRLSHKVIINTFATRNTYRINTVSSIVYSVLLMSIQVYIWRAFYALGKSNDIESIGLESMLTYVLFSSCVSVFVNFEACVIPKIGRKIVFGEIASDLVKPVGLFKYMFLEYIGASLYKICFNLLPVICFAGLLGVRVHSSWLNVFFFTLSATMGCILYFNLSYLVGLFCFWYKTVGNLNILMDSAITLCSGSIIPLWLLPNNMVAIVNILPFKAIYYSPILIGLGRINSNEIVDVFLLQGIWIAVIAIIIHIVYRAGIKKIEIMGG